MDYKICVFFVVSVSMSITEGNSNAKVERKRVHIGTLNRIQPSLSHLNPRRINIFLPDSLPLHQTECRTIPNDFGLCYGMEYSLMRLPNLLGHATMTEVKQQSRSWPPLVSNRCHPETRKFLCSLYAPVCMKDGLCHVGCQPHAPCPNPLISNAFRQKRNVVQKHSSSGCHLWVGRVALGHQIKRPQYRFGRSISPCRSLCVAVRDACSPSMAQFGFAWPEMLNCTKFPDQTAENLCIPESNLASSPEPKTCPPCRQKKVAKAIRKKYCSFDFVMKIRVTRLEFDQGGTRITINKKSRKAYKWPSSVPKSKRRSLWMRDGLHCTCSVIKSNKARYLVTGWKVGKNLVLHAITKWSRKYRKIVKKMKKLKCAVKS